MDSLIQKISLELIAAERERQELLKAQGRFKYTLLDIELSDSQKLNVIIEEVGEVARNVLAREEFVSDGNPSNEALLEELVQIAALSCAWIERLIVEKQMIDVDALEHYNTQLRQAREKNYNDCVDREA